MAPTDPTPELDARFSSPGADPTPWAAVRATIDAAEVFWVSTVRADGRPHVTPLPAVWDDGALCFCTGEGEQKAVNLARDPRCCLTTGTDRWRRGLDVVVEGAAERVVDGGRLEHLAARWRDDLGWPFTAVDGGFRDERVAGAGAPADARTAVVYAVAPTKVLAFAKGEPFAQTRFRVAARA